MYVAKKLRAEQHVIKLKRSWVDNLNLSVLTN